MQGRQHRASILFWLRDHSRRLITLALFALMLQFVGGFGHTHLTHGGRTFAFKSPSVAKPTLANADFASVEARTSIEKAMPSHDADGDLMCVLCLAGHLVASAVKPLVPTLALPIAYLLLGPPQGDAFHSGFGDLISFWSRGPPLS